MKPLFWTTACIGDVQENEANIETPERAENRSLPDWAVSQSPADTDALLAGPHALRHAAAAALRRGWPPRWHPGDHPG